MSKISRGSSQRAIKFDQDLTKTKKLFKKLDKEDFFDDIDKKDIKDFKKYFEDEFGKYISSSERYQLDTNRDGYLSQSEINNLIDDALAEKNHLALIFFQERALKQKKSKKLLKTGDLALRMVFS